MTQPWKQHVPGALRIGYNQRILVGSFALWRSFNLTVRRLGQNP